MANQAEQPSSPKMSLKQLRDSLTPQQRRLITLFWQHFVVFSDWPKSVEIHRKYEKEKTASYLRSIGGDIKHGGQIVREENSTTGLVYQLAFLGIFLTKNGKNYEKWFV
jgi:hypothetical protein